MTALEIQIKRIIENLQPDEAAKEILRLFGVVGRSEQLACIHKLERLRLIGGNITCLDCQSIWVRQAN